jgi:hypothetical protein
MLLWPTKKARISCWYDGVDRLSFIDLRIPGQVEDLKATIEVLKQQLAEKTKQLNEHEAKEAKNKKVRKILGQQMGLLLKLGCPANYMFIARVASLRCTVQREIIFDF